MSRIIITVPAQSDLQDHHDWWARHRSVEQAGRWYVGFLKRIGELSASWEKCRLAAENGRWSVELRQLNFGLGRRPTHRAVFTVRNHEIVILRVRHLAQMELLSIDIEI